jgi:hypothetical protein
MSERFSAVLHDEARAIAVPPPPTGAVLARARLARRRRRTTVAASAAFTVAAVTGGTFLVSSQLDRSDEVTFSVDSYREQGALAVDGKLYVAGRRVPFERAVKSFSYTADGVVVRSGTSPWTDDADVDHYTLVKADGSRTELDLETNDRVVATEPDSNRLAYAEPTSDGRWAVVVTDLDTGADLSRTVLGGRFTWGGWEAPPVALDGDLVWVHFDGGWSEVDWRTGEVRQVPDTRNVFEIANGRYASVLDGQWTIRSIQDGSTVSVIDVGNNGYGFFSPDGRYLRFFDQRAFNGKGWEPFFYDADTAQRAPVPPERDLGWTPDGDVLALGADGNVRICQVGGDCQPSGLTVEVKKDSVVKLGGNDYES